MRRWLAGVSLLALVSCGGSKTAPTPPPPANAAIAGGWSGTYEFSANGTRQVPIVFVMDLTQAGGTINGTYSTTIFNGTVSGTVTPSAFSGTLTFNAQTVSGAPCTGTMAVSGSAGASTMSWTSPLVSASCTGTPTAITIAVQRR